MFTFSDALLKATYVNGKPPTRTEAHEKAELHPFKTEHLFKNKQIPKGLYVARLIQQFLIIKAIEQRLQELSNTDKDQINAFFTLSYLEDLWRTLPMSRDMAKLGIDAGKILYPSIATNTKKYLAEIDKLNPKNLLAHFLFHVAGFMHGGGIIRYKFINPSNRASHYEIPSEQYDFSSAVLSLRSPNSNSLKLYEDMMQQIDKISLDQDEYQAILEQGKSVYETMTDIYDDLYDMHIKQPKYMAWTFALCMISVFVMGALLKLLTANTQTLELTNNSFQLRPL